jgi:hypothetical protein
MKSSRRRRMAVSDPKFILPGVGPPNRNEVNYVLRSSQILPESILASAGAMFLLFKAGVAD